MPLQGSLPFYECPNSVRLALLISRVYKYIYIYVYKHNLFILIYILRRRKFIHIPDNAHLFYIIVFHAHLAIPCRILPEVTPTWTRLPGFTTSSATLSVADSWPIHWKFSVFCRFRVGLAGVTGVLTWWRHQMETLSTLLALCEGNPGGGHRSVPLTKVSDAELWYFLIYVLTNGWANNRYAGDLRRHRAHYDVDVIKATRPTNIWIHGSELYQHRAQRYRSTKRVVLGHQHAQLEYNVKHVSSHFFNHHWFPIKFRTSASSCLVAICERYIKPTTACPGGPADPADAIRNTTLVIGWADLRLICGFL